MAPAWSERDVADPTVCHSAFRGDFAVGFLDVPIVKDESRRCDRGLFLFGKEDAGDGCAAGGFDFRKGRRVVADFAADYVISSVAVIRERSAG